MRMRESEPIQPIEQPEIRHEEIKTLREPIQNLLNQLREKIDRADYSLLIGDDASGRIPTLIFRKILRELYKPSGEKTPETLFVAGSGSGNKAIAGEVLEQKKQAIHELLRQHVPDKRVLVITDTIYTGKSLDPLLASLREMGYNFDVITISTYPENPESGNYYLTRVAEKFDCEVYTGMYGMPEPTIFRASALSGVEKEFENLHATPVRKNEEQSEGKLQQARKDASILAQELVEWYQSK